MVTSGRVGRLLGRGAAFVVLLLVAAELLLRVASLFAHDKSGSGWRPGARVHVLAVGDSHTYGGTVGADETYPAQLQHFLDEARPGAYSVLNLGIPSMNTAQLRNRFAVNLARWNPDVVIVWCGVNNAWNAAETHAAGVGRRVDAVALHSKVYKLLRVALNDRGLNLEVDQRIAAQRLKIETVDRRTHIDPFLGAVTSEDRGADKVDQEAFESAVDDYDSMASMARGAGARLLFITYPLEFERFTVVNRAMREVGTREGIAVVDGSAGHYRVPGEENRYTWALHPSAAVYREIARDVAARVLALTEDDPSRTTP